VPERTLDGLISRGFLSAADDRDVSAVAAAVLAAVRAGFEVWTPSSHRFEQL
jgi:hypothetical protein